MILPPKNIDQPRLNRILHQANVCFANEDWNGARQYLEQAVVLAPEHAQLHAAVGIVTFKIEDYAASCLAFDASLKLSPENPDVLIQYATVLIKLDRKQEAAQVLDRVLRLRSSDSTALALLAGLKQIPLSNPCASRTQTPHRVALDPGLSLEIGDYSYIDDNRLRNPSKAPVHVSIGRFCSIAVDLTIIGLDHRTDWITTYPFLHEWHRKRWPGTQEIPYPSAPEHGGCIHRGEISIGHDVWIGYDVKLFRGVTIGNGAVIGACSLVNKDVPPYAIVAGSPARHIRWRFPDEHIDFLQSIEWWHWPVMKINRYMPFLCSACINELRAQLAEDEQS